MIKVKSNSRLYNIWSHMKKRCYKNYCKDYKYYGARGIIVCEEWKSNFQSFANWAINNGYEEKLTIDRKDNYGNYEPTNCRWLTSKEQARNRRMQSNNKSGCTGVSFNQRMRKWKVGLKSGDEKIHLGYFQNFEDAVKARKEGELKYYD